MPKPTASTVAGDARAPPRPRRRSCRRAPPGRARDSRRARWWTARFGVDRAGQQLGARRGRRRSRSAAATGRPPYRRSPWPTTTARRTPEYRSPPASTRSSPSARAGARDGLDEPRRRRRASPRPDAAGERRPREPHHVRARRRAGSRSRVVGWVGSSRCVLFLICAQIQQAKVSDAAAGAARRRRLPADAPNTILVLGSDARTKGTEEPGADDRRPEPLATRSCSCASAAAHSARLSIPRDTVVDIPGHGRNKINAAYAIGGPALAIKTVEQYLGIDDQPRRRGQLRELPASSIDALGGIDLHGRLRGLEDQRRLHATAATRCACKAGEHAPRRQAGARARPHPQERVQPERERPHARAPPAEDPRARSRTSVISLETFVRLPWVSWDGAEGDPLRHGAARRCSASSAPS